MNFVGSHTTLRVPGATLYYERRGDGPLLLMIPGGVTDATAYKGLVAELSRRYSVLTYDPRGTSRSFVEEPPAPFSIDTQADDAAELIRRLGNGPAYVFAAGGGAQVGLNLAARYPYRVRALVAHEPLCFPLLADPEPAFAAVEACLEIYRRDGLEAAIAHCIAECVGMLREGSAPRTYSAAAWQISGAEERNWRHYFEEVMRPISHYRPDVESLRFAPFHRPLHGGARGGHRPPTGAVSGQPWRLPLEARGIRFPAGGAARRSRSRSAPRDGLETPGPARALVGSRPHQEPHAMRPLLPLGLCLALLVPAASFAQEASLADRVNGADLTLLPDWADAEASSQPVAAVIRLQVLLDRAGVSPGVIDGFMGDNVRKAIAAYEAIHGLPVDGALDADVVARIDTPEAVVTEYAIVAEDAAGIVAPLPADFAELAQRDSLGYTSIREKLAERFHMDEDLLQAMNPEAAFTPGEAILVAEPGAKLDGAVARLEADKALGQLRAYDSAGALLAAYPATIGSADNPSPDGTHLVNAVVLEPNYTYNPENFVQGGNREVLILPPGPNNPVGSVWIDLSEPTYGIHGTPEPSRIDKTRSHGCVRLTNWDAEELAGMVEAGVEVSFVS
jgi:lipoprotein-anchoring transpeptidase ErfK/SrfK